MFTVSYHYQSQQETNVGEDLEIREPLCTVGGYKLVEPLWKTVWRFLKKLKLQLPYDPVIQLLCINWKKTKALIRKDIKI